MKIPSIAMDGQGLRPLDTRRLLKKAGENFSFSLQTNSYHSHTPVLGSGLSGTRTMTVTQ